MPRRWSDDGERQQHHLASGAGTDDLRIGIAETGRIGCGAIDPMRWFRMFEIFLALR